jgi:hypothetical protein
VGAVDIIVEYYNATQLGLPAHGGVGRNLRDPYHLRAATDDHARRRILFAGASSAHGGSGARRRVLDRIKAGSDPIISSSVMPALVAGIHVFLEAGSARKSWMDGISPAMTSSMWFSLGATRSRHATWLPCAPQHPRGIARPDRS